MNRTFMGKTDRELIHVIIQDPNGSEGKAAKEELEYRNYQSVKLHNKWLLILTLVLAGSAILQVIVGLINGR